MSKEVLIRMESTMRDVYRANMQKRLSDILKLLEEKSCTLETDAPHYQRFLKDIMEMLQSAIFDTVEMYNYYTYFSDPEVRKAIVKDDEEYLKNLDTEVVDTVGNSINVIYELYRRLK